MAWDRESHKELDRNFFNLKNIKKVPPLSKEQEREIFKLYKSGSKKAEREIVIRNVKFVIKVALNYKTKFFKLSDLVNEGCMGLLRAAKEFDPSRDYKFITYAVWWIRAYITRAIYEREQMIKIPQNKKNVILRSAKNQIELDDDLELLKIMNDYPLSIDSKINGSSEHTYLDVLEDKNEYPDKNIEDVGIRKILEETLSKIPEKEADVLKGVCGFDSGYPMTLEHIANKLNLSKERIRQLKTKGLKKIKKRYLREIKEVL